MDTLAKYGHPNMVEFIASAIPYVEDVAAFYSKTTEFVDAEAFLPVRSPITLIYLVIGLSFTVREF